jgi:polyisoprenoid-binding protein YceI
MKRLIPALLLACGLGAAPAFAEAPPAPSGDYVLDKSHASLVFKIDHLGLTNYTARFTRFDAQLHLDAADIAASSVTATIDPASLQTDYPDPDYDFNGQISGPQFLDAPQFPEMTFTSTKVEATGEDSARITGDLTLHGVTHEVVLEARLNGAYPRQPWDETTARIGFSAHGTLLRSDFGISDGIPAPGTHIGVGDAVEVFIEAEFTGPAAP